MGIKFEIRYSWIYNVIMNKFYWKYSIKEHKKLQKDCKSFEKLFYRNIGKIQKLIEKHAGKGKWSYTFIPVYIIKYRPNLFKKGINFADPLTLKYRKNEKRMLFVFIHELIHNYLLGQIERGRKKNEALVCSITERVWEELSLGPIPKKEK